MYILASIKKNILLTHLGQILPKISHPASQLFSRNQSSFFVLLPDPKDGKESNSILQESFLPDFKNITAEKCFSGVGQKSLDYEAGIWSMEDGLKEKSLKPTFDNILSTLDNLDESLANVWSIAKLLYTVKNNDVSTSVYLKIHERARKARVSKYQSEVIHKACKNIFVNETGLDEVQKRVLHRYLLECRLNGMELSSSDMVKLREILRKLEIHKSKYKKNLEDANKLFSYRIMDKEMVQGMPSDLLKFMSTSSDPSTGPWLVTHNPYVYPRFLEWCPDKEMRWNAWNAYVLRCSMQLEKKVSNAKAVEEVRHFKNEQAKILGFKNFVEMSMETKMAGSADNILDVIASSFAKAKGKQMEEIKTLKEFATDEGFRGEFEQSDVPYWRRKHLESLIGTDAAQLHEYFPFEFVWEQLLALCSNLFGVHFEEQKSDSFSTWHSDVKLYNILDHNGAHVSSLYVDPFKRPDSKLEPTSGAGWMMSLKKKSVLNEKSLAAIVFNFNPPSGDSPSLLTIADLEELFKKFGQSLQHLLSTVPYGQVSGVTNIEWDAVELCSNFMVNWLYEPSVLQKMSRHHKTNEPLTNQMIENILLKRRHMAAYDFCQELFLSHFDIQLYTEETFWWDLLKNMWPVYMPFPFTKNHALPCWFSPIISDLWGSAYYSHLWSQMLAADTFNAFKECQAREVPEVGRRFSETFLSLGGGRHSAEVFRKFRGRDPMPDALHTLLGIS